MALLIRNGEIVTASERFVADIRTDGERIAEIGPGLDAPPGTETVDAAGMLVFPGFVDPHTHIHLPAMGTLGRDTYETASRAALLGGTTCFFDFCTPAPDEDPRAALATWRAKSEGKSACDYAFHQAVTRFDARVEAQLRGIVREGIPSFKVFLAYEGTLGISDAAWFSAFRSLQCWPPGGSARGPSPVSRRSASALQRGADAARAIRRESALSIKLPFAQGVAA